MAHSPSPSVQRRRRRDGVLAAPCFNGSLAITLCATQYELLAKRKQHLVSMAHSPSPSVQRILRPYGRRSRRCFNGSLAITLCATPVFRPKGRGVSSFNGSLAITLCATSATDKSKRLDT